MKTLPAILALAATVVTTTAFAQEKDAKCGAGSCGKKEMKAGKKDAACSKKEAGKDAGCGKKDAGCSKKDASCGKK